MSCRRSALVALAAVCTTTVLAQDGDGLSGGSLVAGERAEDGSTLLALREERGTLAADDAMLSSGEYFDTHEFTGEVGQRVRIDLRSGDFDTYLILVPPKGEQEENDDASSTSHSSIETELTTSGAFRVIVTSYEAGETGEYTLEIAPSDAAPARIEEATTIAVGQSLEGVLEAGDRMLSDGEYRDLYEFEGEAGDSVRVEMTSPVFDTYLALVTSSGEAIQNDDHEGDARRSVIKLSLPDSGRFRILATSYAPGETGAYTLTLTSADANAVVAEPEPGRVFGLFAGISDYPGKKNDLVYTADDALRLRDALIDGGGMSEANQITLIDEQVTRAALSEALRELGRRTGPDDRFVFFFSGHGERVAREAGPHPTDPDALDETLELYDGSMTDDELRALFAEVKAGTSMIFIDACYSGGFAKDLISVPGRMGLFSSEEDVTSSVAAKFQAGGYLSLFLAEAISEKRADTDGDGAVSAIELSQYVYDRYRVDVKADDDEFVRSSGPRTGHQHLIVDRGSIGPHDVLFR